MRALPSVVGVEPLGKVLGKPHIETMGFRDGPQDIHIVKAHGRQNGVHLRRTASALGDGDFPAFALWATARHARRRGEVGRGEVGQGATLFGYGAGRRRAGHYGASRSLRFSALLRSEGMEWVWRAEP